MDFTIFQTCPSCKRDTLRVAAASFGGRVNVVKLKCDDCNICIALVPMSKEYQYDFIATTAEERREKNRLRECASATIREVAQPLADERDEYRGVVENFVKWMNMERKAAPIKEAEAILSKYPKP